MARQQVYSNSKPFARKKTAQRAYPAKTEAATNATQIEQAFTAAALVGAGAAVVVGVGVEGTAGAIVVVEGATDVVVVVGTALLICNVARLEQLMTARQRRTRTEKCMVGLSGDYWIEK